MARHRLAWHGLIVAVAGLHRRLLHLLRLIVLGLRLLILARGGLSVTRATLILISLGPLFGLVAPTTQG